MQNAVLLSIPDNDIFFRVEGDRGTHRYKLGSKPVKKLVARVEQSFVVTG